MNAGRWTDSARDAPEPGPELHRGRPHVTLKTLGLPQPVGATPAADVTRAASRSPVRAAVPNTPS